MNQLVHKWKAPTCTQYCAMFDEPGEGFDQCFNTRAEAEQHLRTCEDELDVVSFGIVEYDFKGD